MATAVVIENPIINSPFFEPTRHFDFTDDGISDQILDGRRESSYFVPIASSRKKGGKQLAFDTEWTKDRIEKNKLVNDIRARVGLWRKGGHLGVTPTTSRLLDYWTHPDREKKLFFCQIEALETAIYLTEVAKKYGDAWLDNRLREENDKSNPGLPRQAFKMATGSGKTVVMAMLIAWQALNKFANAQDARFSDTFLIVTPGITILDRQRVLMPNDPQNYYRERDVCPPHQRGELGRAKILITNFHAFQQREKIAAGKLTKSILSDGGPSPFTETPDEMVRRVCRELGTKRNVVVLNDEAHHCYRRRPEVEDGGRVAGTGGHGGGTGGHGGPPLQADVLGEKLTGRSGSRRSGGRRRRGSGSRGSRRSRRRSGCGRSTIFRRRRSSCAAPGTRRARSSPGSSPTSR